MANGLISQAEQQLAQNQPGAAALPVVEGAAVDDSGGVSAQAQEIYTSAMQMAGELLHKDEKSSDGIIEQVKAADGIPEGIAEATDLVLSQIEDAFNGKLPDETILHLGDEISDLVIELVEADGTEMTPEIADQAKVLTGLKIMEEYGVEPTDYEENAAATFAQEDMAGVESVLAGAA